ncbi:MAG: DNA methyltransferase [Polyangiaceae bacterium]
MAAKKSPRTAKRSGASSHVRGLSGAARRIAETTGKAPPPRPRAPKQRRALTNVGGEAEISGDAELAKVLGRALKVKADEERTRRDVHGFHTYPARMHPDTAFRLVEALAPAAGRVLDPFCGSGTVLAEARRAGCHAFGVDANPLAVELSWLKTRGLAPRERNELIDAAVAVRDHADTRRKKKQGATQRFPDADVQLFEPHVLLELDGLRDGIRQLPEGDMRRLLWLVLSSLIGKVSRRAADTNADELPRRIGAGYTAKLFQRRTEELVKRMVAYGSTVPPRAPVAKVMVGDARDLSHVRDGGMDLIVSSPPYAGVYDYFDHHAARLRWLGLEARSFQARELGSRRKLSAEPFAKALGRYQQDLGAALGEMARVLCVGGHLALQVADSTLAQRAVHADRLVEQLAQDVGLTVAARAAQRRPHFHGASQRAFAGRPRAEHLLLLVRS